MALALYVNGHPDSFGSRYSRISTFVNAATFTQVSAVTQAYFATGTSTSTSTVASYASRFGVFTKGLLIWGDVISNKLSMPSISQILAAGFTIVGCNYNTRSQYDSSMLSSLHNWISQASAADLATFVAVGSSYTVASSSLSTILEIGAQYVNLDEPMGSWGWTGSQLQGFVNSALTNPQTSGIIINEFNEKALQMEYALFGNNVKVLFAEDSYNDMPLIDYNIQLGATYGKTAIAWLCFTADTHSTFDSYIHLSAWITYVKQRNTATWFYAIDDNGKWEANWVAVAGY